MSVKDFLQRFLFDAMPIRGEYIHLEETYQTILNQHNYPSPLRQLLGEALCVAGLLTAIIKFDGRLTVQFRGQGNLKLLLAQCDNQFRLRGLAKWDGELSYSDLMEAFNHGILVIMLDSAAHTNRYQGIVAWRGNSLVESIEGYFRESEQLATKIWLSVDDDRAAGYLLQIVPTKNKEANKQPTLLENEIFDPHWQYITKLTESLTPEDLLNKPLTKLLNNLYPEEAIRLFSEEPVKFGCTCSRKRSEDAIYLLGREEAEAELENKQTIVVTCDFCNQEYLFDRVDVAKIFDSREKPPNTQLH